MSTKRFRPPAFSKFADWYKANRERNFSTLSATSCPVAQYLRTIPGGEAVTVGSSVLQYQNDRTGHTCTVKLPRPYMRFVREFDSLDGDNDGQKQGCSIAHRINEDWKSARRLGAPATW